MQASRRSPPPSAPVTLSSAAMPKFPTVPPVATSAPVQKAVLSKSYSTPADRNVPKPHSRWGPGRNPQHGYPRAQSTFRKQLSVNAANFFGIPPRAESVEALEESQKWASRRLRHCNRAYGAVRGEPSAPEEGVDLIDMITTSGQVPPSREVPLKEQRTATLRLGSVESTGSTFGRSGSEDSRPSRIRVLQRRDSVAKMAWDGLSSLVTTGSLKPPKAGQSRRRFRQRSFTPGSLALEDSVFESPMTTPEGLATPSISGVTSGTLPECFPMETIQEAHEATDISRVDRMRRGREQEVSESDVHVALHKDHGPSTPPMGEAELEVVPPVPRHGIPLKVC